MANRSDLASTIPIRYSKAISNELDNQQLVISDKIMLLNVIVPNYPAPYIIYVLVLNGDASFHQCDKINCHSRENNQGGPLIVRISSQLKAISDAIPSFPSSPKFYISMSGL